MNLVINGIRGKMGGYLYEKLKTMDQFKVVAGISRQVDFKLDVPIYHTLEACFVKEDVDIVIDFSDYPKCLDAVKTSIMNGKHVISGTTGYKTYDGNHIGYLANKQGVGVVISPNFSLNDDYLNYLESCRKRYPYVYLSESHNIQKKDIPSGTARYLSKRLAIDEDKCFSFRLPNVLAEHTLYFSDGVEKIILTHQVDNRDAFVEGVIDSIYKVYQEKEIQILI